MIGTQMWTLVAEGGTFLSFTCRSIIKSTNNGKIRSPPGDGHWCFLQSMECQWSSSYSAAAIRFIILKTVDRKVNLYCAQFSKSLHACHWYFLTWKPTVGTRPGLSGCQSRILNIIHVARLSIYSAFANSCPLQTDTFLFPLIHSHHVLLPSNKF